MTSTTGREVPKRRWMIGVLLGIGVLINYFDRINISVAGPQLTEAFKLTPGELGVLFSAFFWPYALLQVPAGLLLDRYGLAAGDCIFVDDSAKNIEGARGVGMQAVHFVEPIDLRSELRERGLTL